jgi:hypothetical protein
MRGPVDAQPCETRCGHAIAACPSTTGRRAPREVPGSPVLAWSVRQRPMRLPTGAPTTSPSAPAAVTGRSVIPTPRRVATNNDPSPRFIGYRQSHPSPSSLRA